MELLELLISKEYFLLEGHDIVPPCIYGFNNNMYDDIIRCRSAKSDCPSDITCTLSYQMHAIRKRAGKLGLIICDEPLIKESDYSPTLSDEITILSKN